MMRFAVLACGALLLLIGTAQAQRGGLETRCGWFSNPTPGNAWLDDKDGQWIIAVQGGHQADGDWPPDFKPGQWVRTNGPHGYGCACLRVRVDRKSHQVLEIKGGQARPLAVCRKDRSLREPKDG